MTKQEAILYCDAFAATQDSAQAKTAMKIAVECIKHCINGENEDKNFCNLVEHQHCSICGKLVEDTENYICEDCFNKFNEVWK